jgi:hypothetical protein
LLTESALGGAPALISELNLEAGAGRQLIGALAEKQAGEFAQAGLMPDQHEAAYLEWPSPKRLEELQTRGVVEVVAVIEPLKIEVLRG